MAMQLTVNYAAAEAWKQRAIAAAMAERLARQAVKAALTALKAKGTVAQRLADKACIASEAAIRAAREAEQVWADTAATLSDPQQKPTGKD